MATATIREVPETAYNLGELVEDFRVSRDEVLSTAAVLVFCFLFCPIGFYFKDPGLIAPVDAGDYLMILGCVSLMLVFLCVGTSLMLTIHAKRHMRVLLYEEGLVCFKPEQVFSCRWDEVEWTKEVFGLKECAVLDALIVHCRSGAEWTLDRRTEALGDSGRLASRIQTEVAAAAGPDVLARLLSDESVAFGAVTLSSAGIMYRDQMLAWADVEAIEPHGFGLKIRRRGGWFVWATIAGSELVNKHLLLAVALTMKTDLQGADAN